MRAIKPVHLAAFVTILAAGMCAFILWKADTTQPSMLDLIEQTERNQFVLLNSQALQDAQLPDFHTAQCQKIVHQQLAKMRSFYRYYNQRIREDYNSGGRIRATESDRLRVLHTLVEMRQIRQEKRTLCNKNQPLPEIDPNAVPSEFEPLGLPYDYLRSIDVKGGGLPVAPDRRTNATDTNKPLIKAPNNRIDRRTNFERMGLTKPAPEGWVASSLKVRNQIPSCGYDTPLVFLMPGFGPDTVAVTPNTEAIVYDLGDSESGPDLDNHDKLLLFGAPTEWELSRHGDTLLACNPQRRTGVVVIRQYCKTSTWNNTFESINFQGGLSYLEPELFDQLKPGERYMTAVRAGLIQVFGSIVDRWQTYPVPIDLLPNHDVNTLCAQHPTRLTKAERMRLEKILEKRRLPQSRTHH